jgi:hypothetical protein
MGKGDVPGAGFFEGSLSNKWSTKQGVEMRAKLTDLVLADMQASKTKGANRGRAKDIVDDMVKNEDEVRSYVTGARRRVKTRIDAALYNPKTGHVRGTVGATPGTVTQVRPLGDDGGADDFGHGEE